MEYDFGKKYPEAMKQIKQCNILVIGNTGVGKSTLISALFQIPISNSVTQTISEKPYTKQGLSINVYDTPGLEKNKKQRDKVKQDIDKFLKQKNQKEPEEQIHLVWYCVNSQVTRQSEIDQQWIALIAKELPVIAVITRASGCEKEWLRPYLENNSNIQGVVSVMAKPETHINGEIESSSLDSLLKDTEKFLEEIAQKAILNAVNAKANEAFGWCRDGCAKVLATQILPISILKSPAVSGLQTWMLADISKTFGYHFKGNTFKELCTVGVGFAGFDSFIEQSLKNLPGIDYNNIQTVQDVLTHLKTLLENTVGSLPFKEELGELLTSVANINPVSGLPILSCLTAISTTLSTGFLAVAYIETLKKYKKAEYKGQPMPELKEVFAEQMQDLMELSRQLFRRGWLPGFANQY